jgi:hypothetical protein
MADQDTGTGDNGDLGTGGTPPAATPPDQKPIDGKPAATDPGDQSGDDSVNLSRKDYNNLIAQRDRANNNGQQSDESLAQLQYDFYKGKAVDEAAKKFPDVPRDILETAETPEQMETLATKFQQHAEKVKQDALKDLTTVDTGQLTPEQKADKLKTLKNSGKLGEAIGVLLGK